MQTIFVKYKTESGGGQTRIKNSINLRKCGGAYYCALKNSLKSFAKSKSSNDFEILTECIARYFFGQRKFERRFSENFDRRLKKINPPDTLYHFLPVEHLDSVMTHGLKSQSGLIYLTDSVQHIIDEGYLQYKANIRGKDTEFYILEINAAHLKNAVPIYSSHTEHEYIVKSVDKKFIK